MKSALSYVLTVTMLVMLAIMAFATMPALAQDVVIPVVSDTDFLGHLLQSVGQFKGATTLVIVGLAVQILIKFLGTELFGRLFKKVTGATKLTIYLSLSLIGGVSGLMLTADLTFGAALVHSSTLAAFGLLLNQIYKQFVEKKD